MASKYENHNLSLNPEDLICFTYLNSQRNKTNSERIRELINEDLAENKEIILRGIDNQRARVEKRFNKK